MSNSRQNTYGLGNNMIRKVIFDEFVSDGLKLDFSDFFFKFGVTFLKAISRQPFGIFSFSLTDL